MSSPSGASEASAELPVPSSSSAAASSLTIELSGGLELLFSGQRSLQVALPAAGRCSIKALLALLRDSHLQERPELFMAGDSVRPGILVLINEVDWELEGMLAAEVAHGDTVTLISTLHGG
jgi:ubiquitin related modifier 1